MCSVFLHSVLPSARLYVHNIFVQSSFFRQRYNCLVMVGKRRASYARRTPNEYVIDIPVSEEGFDPVEDGKPIITRCEAIERAGKLFSNFSWEYPKISNFESKLKIVAREASIMTNNKKTVLKIQNEKVDDVELNWGTRYTFCLTIFYQLSDETTTTSAKATQFLDTGISTPTDLRLECHEKYVDVKWARAQGATYYVVKVVSGATSIADSTKLRTASFRFEMSELCRHGLTCEFLVKAYGEGDSKEIKRHLLIGGDYAVTNVVARRSERNPRREILVTWQQPENKPDEYQIYLYEMASTDGSFFQKEKITSEQASYSFIDLNPGRTYRCKVSPVYEMKERGGTMSENVSTNKRKENPMEKSKEFGKPVEVRSRLGVDNADLWWIPPDLGENFSLRRYEVTVTKQGFVRRVFRARTFDKPETFKVFPPEASYHISKIEKGSQYDVKVTCIFKDKDDNLEKISDPEEIAFHTSPETAKDFRCKCEEVNRVVVFSWKPVNGASEYKLELTDEFSNEILDTKSLKAPDQTSECVVRISMYDGSNTTGYFVEIGKVCKARVKAFSEGGSFSETSWTSHLIGGDKVPRNVKAAPDSQKPCYAVRVTFDSPAKAEPLEYNIVAIPSAGRCKTMLQKDHDVCFQHLKPGVNYFFEVFALYDKEESRGSRSNPLRTKGENDVDDCNSFVAVDRSRGTNFDLTGANFQKTITKINADSAHGENFGQVRDLRADPKHCNRGDEAVEEITISWKVPGFNLDHFRVIHYSLNIHAKHSGIKDRNFKIGPEEGGPKYEKSSGVLEFGEEYTFSVATFYEDILTDNDCTSSNVVTRRRTKPSKPTIITNKWDERAEELIIEWNHVNGASQYTVEILGEGGRGEEEDGSKTILFLDNGKKTAWRRPFDAKIGYGTVYSARRKAIGVDEQFNVTETKESIIGGGQVVRNVKATIDHSKVIDPNTQVFITWDEPIEVPDEYDVAAQPYVSTIMKEFGDRSCLVSGLKAGTYYSFKVEAIGRRNGMRVRSGGCLSNELQTNPTPTKIKKVKFTLLGNKCSSVWIRWDNVDAEKDNETTKYMVTLKNSDEERKEVVYRAEATAKGLNPMTTYSITVAGGNSCGFGKESDPVLFETESGILKDVSFECCAKCPSRRLILKFRDAEGNPDSYQAILYKYTDGKAMQENDMKVFPMQPNDFDGLQSNTFYSVEVFGIFKGKIGQKFSPENTVITAPSKSQITRSCCQSSRQIFIEWNSDKGCYAHEVKVDRGQHGDLEAVIPVKNTEDLQYLCQHEAAEYTVQVRSKNASEHFGEWSSEHKISLAPANLENVIAKLADEKNTIIVKCLKPLADGLKFFMQPVLNGNQLEKIEGKSESSRGIVEFQYEPGSPDEEYKFAAWAEKHAKEDPERILRGNPAVSNILVSRPAKVVLKKVERSRKNPDAEIKISWEGTYDKYEVWIKNSGDPEGSEMIFENAKPDAVYGGLSAGCSYNVRVRAIYNNTSGVWSKKLPVCLAPGAVQLLETEDEAPRKSITVTWKPLNIKPDGYRVKLYCGTEFAESWEGEETEHSFERSLKPGSVYHCTVEAFNKDVNGKSAKTRKYRIPWSSPGFFTAVVYERDPCHTAIMQWDRQYGINCFKLQIENTITGIVTVRYLTCKEDTKQKYFFESGIPACSYNARLFWGHDSRYSSDTMEREFSLYPLPPSEIKVIPNQDIGGLIVELKDNNIRLNKKYTVRLRDVTSSEILKTVSMEQCSTFFKDLTPGKMYKVTASVSANEKQSIEAECDRYAQTFPARVQNLISTWVLDRIRYEWKDVPEATNRYKVQWRNNDATVIDESTTENHFEIQNPKPGALYRLRVIATNTAGDGPSTEWKTFATTPLPPQNIRVDPSDDDPQTRFILKYQDERDPMKTYKVTVEDAVGEKRAFCTDELVAEIDELEPGQPYKISVQTIYFDKESKPAYENTL